MSGNTFPHTRNGPGGDAIPPYVNLRTQLSRSIFNQSRWVYQVLPDKSDRELFSFRVANWLSGGRRGNPKFPSHFPAEVKALSNASKACVRKLIYGFRTNIDQARLTIDDSLSNLVHQVFPDGQISTVNPDFRVHKSQVGEVKPLAKTDWPRLETRPAWPSTPTFIEMLEMSRRGLTVRPWNNHDGYSATYRITACQLKRNVQLASAIVAHQIIGVRSWVKIPRKFLGFFRYRWNFLILTTRWSLPAGLVRFLIGQWKTNPYNLWLKDKCFLRTFLRTRSYTDFICENAGPW